MCTSMANACERRRKRPHKSHHRLPKRCRSLAKQQRPLCTRTQTYLARWACGTASLRPRPLLLSLHLPLMTDSAHHAGRRLRLLRKSKRSTACHASARRSCRWKRVAGASSAKHDEPLPDWMGIFVNSHVRARVAPGARSVLFVQPRSWRLVPSVSRPWRRSRRRDRAAWCL